MVVEPGEGRRESLWVKSLVVLLVVFIGVPSSVFVYRKWVDWRVNVEVEKTIESDEVHDLIEKDLRHIDPLAFTSRGVIKGFEPKKGSGLTTPMGGIFFDVTVYGHEWKVNLHYGLAKAGDNGPIQLTWEEGEKSLYPYLDKAYGKGYGDALDTDQEKEMKGKAGLNDEN